MSSRFPGGFCDSGSDDPEDGDDVSCVSVSDKGSLFSVELVKNGNGVAGAGDRMWKKRSVVLLLIAGGDVCVGRVCVTLEIDRAAT